ncbi:MAG: alpha/beta fold hydrolase [Rhodobacter sp.]|nr:alpha/beta fold hydrolase [Paracoccaceae bacterium]MCB1408199.1 alpha/beta fold hydrolase [Paracoccaceae bacterium]MCC0081095.1 alpha/beta fold hydrolase [Rhodobacter sp.]
MTNSLMAARDAFLARFPESRVDLDGRDWGLIDTGGTGAVFLFLPGTLGRSDVFFQQIEPLAADMRVLAVSYPDSGGVIDWAASLVTLLDRLGIGRVCVLGSSLGGYLAQYFAGTYPDRVQHLFAANTLHEIVEAAHRPPYSLDLWTAPIEDLRKGFHLGMTAWVQAHPDHAEMVEFLLTEADGRIPEPELRARLDGIKTGPDLPPLSHEPGAATVIESADDPLIPPPMRAAVRARNAPAPAFRFAWGGHFPYLIRPALYTGLLRARLGLAPLPADWQSTDDGVMQA